MARTGKTGTMFYIPKDLMDEIECIKKSELIDSNAEALRKIVKYSKKGKESMRL